MPAIADDPDDNIRIEERGSAYVLIRTEAAGPSTEMVLSEKNIITMARSAQRLNAAILARRSSPEVSVVVLTPVARVRLNADLEHSEVHLMMFDQNGAEAGFLLPLAVAEALAERLPARVTEVQESKQGKK
jgi:hypothetical protein